jgi:hypothetical protein
MRSEGNKCAGMQHHQGNRVAGCPARGVLMNRESRVVGVDILGERGDGYLTLTLEGPVLD